MSSLLIWISHGINLAMGGSVYEMLCSRAWRLRRHWFWGAVQVAIDHYSPLGFWRTETMTHCQWCFESERSRCWKLCNRN